LQRTRDRDLDRERAEERRKQGVAKLTREEIRDLRKTNLVSSYSNQVKAVYP
jgi:hypothetical protein